MIIFSIAQCLNLKKSNSPYFYLSVKPASANICPIKEESNQLSNLRTSPLSKDISIHFSCILFIQGHTTAVLDKLTEKQGGDWIRKVYGFFISGRIVWLCGDRRSSNCYSFDNELCVPMKRAWRTTWYTHWYHVTQDGLTCNTSLLAYEDEAGRHKVM